MTRDRSVSTSSRILTARDASPSFRVGIGNFGERTVRSDPFHPVLVFGPQRSGKTSAFVIPAILEWDGPCFVTSVRYDVAQETYKHRARLGNVQIFDPAGSLGGTNLDRVSAAWNPIAGIETWDQALSLASGFCEGGPAGFMNEAFWLAKAKQLLAPLIYAAAKTDPSMETVLRWCALPQDRLMREIGDALDLDDEYGFDLDSRRYQQAPFLDSYSTSSDGVMDRNDTDESHHRGSDLFESARGEDHWCMLHLAAFEGMAENTYGSVVATLTGVLEVFDYFSVARRSRAGSLSISDFVSMSPNTIYLCAPVRQQRLYRPLFTALVRQIIDKTFEYNTVQESDQDKIPLLACLDEAGNVARLDDLDTFATTAAGARIQLVSIFHDLSQLRAAYLDDKAQLILNNHSGLVCLSGMRDPATAEYFTRLLADEEVSGHQHLGWSFGDLRTMAEEKAICVYREMPPLLLSQRRSYRDEKLQSLMVGKG